MILSQCSAFLVVLLGSTLAGSVAGSNASKALELHSGFIPLGHTWHKSVGAQSDFYHAFDGESLTFTRVRTTAEGQDPVAATGGVVALEDFTVTLTGIIPLMLPTITSQPQNQTTTIGGFASFSVTALDAEPLTYQWFKDGLNLLGATSATLTLNNVQTTDAGHYTVIVSNGVDSTASFAVTLTVNTPLIPPRITSQPQDQAAMTGGSTSFSVTATDTQPLTYQWLKNGANIPGATSTTLTLNNVQTADAGIYTVVVSNTSGPVSSYPATLQIIPSPGPLFASPQWSQTTGFSSALRGQPQTSGRVQMSTNLVDWVDLANITTSGGLTQVADPDAANAPSRFYRAVITP